MKKYTHTLAGQTRGIKTLAFSACLLLLLMSACGSQGSSSDTQSGSISFVVQNPSAQAHSSLSQAATLSCSRYDIETVEARVEDADGNIIATGGPWPCNTGEAIMTDVAAGENYTVIVSLRNSSGVVVFQGSTSGVTVVPGVTTDAGSISLSYANHAPVLDIDSTVVHATPGGTLTFDISATDEDGDNLTFDFGNPPKDIWSPYNYFTGVSFSQATANTCTFSWTVPTDIIQTEYPVLIRVSDDGLPHITTTQVVTIQVYSSAISVYPPILDPITVPSPIAVGDTIDFTLGMNDRNSFSGLENPYSAEAISGTSLPDLSTYLDSSTGEFDWTPAAEGNYWIRFSVSLASAWDGADLSDYEDVLFTVGDINRPPRLDPIGDKKYQYNETHQFVVTATDPEYDPITFAAYYIPAVAGPQPVSTIGATFYPDTQVFSWQPDEGDIGHTYTIRFRATDDSGAYHYEDISISVVNE